jgi:hypothetical protein
MACKRSAVRSRLPPPQCREVRLQVARSSGRAFRKALTLSSRGLGHHPFTVATGVRIPVGSPSQSGANRLMKQREAALGSQEQTLHGVVVQLVRIPACHAGGRGFESRPLRQYERDQRVAIARLQPVFRSGTGLLWPPLCTRHELVRDGSVTDATAPTSVRAS